MPFTPICVCLRGQRGRIRLDSFLSLFAYYVCLAIAIAAAIDADASGSAEDEIVPLRPLAPGEFEPDHVMTLQDAAAAFNLKLERAEALGQKELGKRTHSTKSAPRAAAKSGDGVQQPAPRDHRRVDLTESDALIRERRLAEKGWNRTDDLAMLASATGRRLRRRPRNPNTARFLNFTKRRNSFVRPQLAVQMCMQFDLDLSFLLPGAIGSIGLLGAINYHLQDHCWRFTFEASIGFGWRISFLGYRLGIGAQLVGTIDLYETPVKIAMNDMDSIFNSSHLSVYAPDGADLSKCHTRNPWMVVQAFIENEFRRVFQNKSVHEEAAKQRKQHAEKEKAYFDAYTNILNGPFEKREKSVHAPKLSAPAAAIARAMRFFLPKLPPYADQVMQRLVDNDKKNPLGKWYTTLTTKMFEASEGRFWARWPTSKDLELYKRECLLEHPSEPQKCDSLDSTVGVETTQEGRDQRVLNFAKAMRLSKKGEEDPHFWKEIAISASNLLIRVIGDVLALFSAAFANDPNWDGECTSLPVHFHDDKRQNSFLESYPWASKHAKKSLQRAFADRLQDKKGRNFAELVLRKALELNVEGVPYNMTGMFPHLWCALSAAPDEGVVQESPATRVRLDVIQACATVTFDFRSPDGTPTMEDKFVWDPIRLRYIVWRDDEPVGTLYTADRQIVKDAALMSNAGQSPAEYAISKGFKVVESRAIQARLECEYVALPVAFVRLFPRFVSQAQWWVAKMEHILFEMNYCLNELHNKKHVMSRIKELSQDNIDPLETMRTPWQDICGEQKDVKTGTTYTHNYVSEKAKEAVRLVRRYLVKLGAEDPRQVVDKYIPGVNAISETERQEIQATHRLAGFAPAVGLLWEDYAKFLGIEKLPHDSGAKAFMLVGLNWHRVPQLPALLSDAADPQNIVIRSAAVWMRPPVKFTYTLSVTIQSLAAKDAGFCTPNTALLLVTPLQVQWLRNTWSTRVESELCFVGRIRPGDFFISVTYCYSQNRYSDWRVKLFGVINKGNILGPDKSGILGNLLTPGTSEIGTLGASVITGGVLFGAAASGKVLSKFAPYVHKNPVLTAIVMLAGASSPLLGASVAGAAIAGPGGFNDFKKVCETVLQFLSEHGVVTKVPIERPALSPVSIDIALVVWGALVQRAKTVKIDQIGTTANAVSGGQVVKTQQLVSFRAENWNRFDFRLPVPSVAELALYAQLDIRVDLTPWAEYVINYKRWLENNERVAACFKCLENKTAFCDYRPPMGSLWSKDYDMCVPDTPEQRAKCNNIAMEDGSGKLKHAGFYSEEPENCLRLDFPRCNSEPIEGGTLLMFLNRMPHSTVAEVQNFWAPLMPEQPEKQPGNILQVAQDSLGRAVETVFSVNPLFVLMMIATILMGSCYASERCRRILKRRPENGEEMHHITPLSSGTSGTELPPVRSKSEPLARSRASEVRSTRTEPNSRRSRSRNRRSESDNLANLPRKSRELHAIAFPQAEDRRAHTMSVTTSRSPSPVQVRVAPSDPGSGSEGVKSFQGHRHTTVVALRKSRLEVPGSEPPRHRSVTVGESGSSSRVEGFFFPSDSPRRVKTSPEGWGPAASSSQPLPPNWDGFIQPQPASSFGLSNPTRSVTSMPGSWSQDGSFQSCTGPSRQNSRFQVESNNVGWSSQPSRSSSWQQVERQFSIE